MGVKITVRNYITELTVWQFPDGSVVKTQRFHCCGQGLIPGWGTMPGDEAKKNLKIKKRRKINCNTI